MTAGFSPTVTRQSTVMAMIATPVKIRVRVIYLGYPSGRRRHRARWAARGARRRTPPPARSSGRRWGRLRLAYHPESHEHVWDADVLRRRRASCDPERARALGSPPRHFGSGRMCGAATPRQGPTHPKTVEPRGSHGSRPPHARRAAGGPPPHPRCRGARAGRPRRRRRPPCFRLRSACADCLDAAKPLREGDTSSGRGAQKAKLRAACFQRKRRGSVR